MKTCTKCGVKKEDDRFNKDRNQCKDCKNADVKLWKNQNKERVKNNNKEYYIENKNVIQEYKLQWYAENKQEILEDRKQYYVENAENIKKYVKQWRIDNPDYQTNYRNENKESLNENRKSSEKERKKNDPVYRLRNNISRFVNLALKQLNSFKGGKSILKYLSYSFKYLKEHLEKQFEPWMTWENYGRYVVKDWDDNNSTTWKWQVDHIIPNSSFYYISMEDQAFKYCWALENLRHLSAKQNVIDGASRKVGFHV